MKRKRDCLQCSSPDAEGGGLETAIDEMDRPAKRRKIDGSSVDLASSSPSSTVPPPASTEVVQTPSPSASSSSPSSPSSEPPHAPNTPPPPPVIDLDAPSGADEGLQGSSPSPGVHTGGATYRNISLTDFAIDGIRANEWLMDSIIDYDILHTIFPPSIAASNPDSFVFLSTFLPAVSTDVLRAGERNPPPRLTLLFRKSLLLIPHNCGKHWDLYAVCNLPSLDPTKVWVNLEDEETRNRMRVDDFIIDDDDQEDEEEDGEFDLLVESSRRMKKKKKKKRRTSQRTLDRFVTKKRTRREQNSNSGQRRRRNLGEQARRPKPCILHCDSVRNGPNPAVVSLIRKYLTVRYKVEAALSSDVASLFPNPSLSSSSSLSSNPSGPLSFKITDLALPCIQADVMQQPNQVDCGVYMLEFIEEFIHRGVPKIFPPAIVFELLRIEERRKRLFTELNQIRTNQFVSKNKNGIVDLSNGSETITLLDDDDDDDDVVFVREVKTSIPTAVVGARSRRQRNFSAFVQFESESDDDDDDDEEEGTENRRRRRRRRKRIKKNKRIVEEEAMYVPSGDDGDDDDDEFDEMVSSGLFQNEEEDDDEDSEEERRSRRTRRKKKGRISAVRKEKRRKKKLIVEEIESSEEDDEENEL